MKNLVKIFTVTKDETDLINDFVLYHGSIFGYTNIVLIDNMSSCPIVLNLYRKFRNLGVNIESHASYEGNSQGQAFTKSMSRHKNTCRFLVGLDTDEFIQVPGFTTDPFKWTSVHLKSKFEIYFNSLPKEATKFSMSTYYNSVPNTTSPGYIDQKLVRPATDTIYFQKTTAKKYFFRSNAFLSTVNGCHNGKTTRGKEHPTSVCYIHFHNTGARRTIERARGVINGYNYTDTSSDLNRQLVDLSRVSSPIGYHRVLEYAIFLSKILTLNEMIAQKRWPLNANHLHHLALDFRSVHGFPDYSDYPSTISLPDDWKDSYDRVVFYDPPLEKVEGLLSCGIVQRVVSEVRSDKRVSIALMMSGHLRNFEKRSEFWKEFKLNFPEIDIFVHTWSENGQRGGKEWINVGSNKSNHDEAKEILKPTKMMIEDHEELLDGFSFKEQGVDLYYTKFPAIATTKDFTKYIGSQLYSIKKCFELTQSQGKKYDLYLRIRGDSILENVENLFKYDLGMINSNTVVINGSRVHIHPGGGRGCGKCDSEYGGKRRHKIHTNDVCDIFYYGRLEAMSRICLMYDSVQDIVRGFQQQNKKMSKKPCVSKHLKRFGYISTVDSPHVYENEIKCFYPERLIREYMKNYWLISDPFGLVPRIVY